MSEVPIRKACATPLEDLLAIHQYFAEPSNAPQLLFASDKTAYTWQHM